MVSAEASARAGLLGNPSDGYGGRTLAVAIPDFRAQVTVCSAPELSITPPARLVEAAVRRFAAHADVALQPCAITWRTTVPREVGLAGSSAIVIATLRALAAFHEVCIPRDALPAVALAVETEDLGIAAGLQDRVVQSLGGLVFMDFGPNGGFQALDPALLPPLYVAWRPDAAGASGVVHHDLRARFDAGEPGVRGAMRELADLAREGRDALVGGEPDALGPLMARTLALRRRLMPLDPRHLELCAAAARAGLPATYTGSGGAVVGACADPERLDALRRHLRGIGGHVLAPRLAAPLEV